MKRIHIHVTGIVQGVGFRPFVYNLAKKLNLNGWVLNSSEGVHIEVEGEERVLSTFLELLQKEKPPRAEIKTLKISELEPFGYAGFEIRESEKKEEEFVLVSPDIATCNECLKELFNPLDRRFRYPFINCTNCGPRFTIIEDIPYDRPKTTMKKFKMCPECQKEYDDPLNRRFHAQPNACPVCGPHLMFIARTEIFKVINEEGKPLENMELSKLNDFEIKPARGFSYLEREDALLAAEKILKNGMILAVKGLGGFHLACQAKNQEAVDKLRMRKKRPSKAFAVMFKNLSEVEKAVYLTEEAADLLTSPQAPIVLLPKKYPEYLAENIAPGLSEYGVMLPSTPLHHLLLSDMDEPLVMTSGNLTEEPIAKDNKEALERLSSIADGFLIHNRPIHSRYDDSVLSASRKIFMIRRARSYAPYPLDFPFTGLPSIFGAGPELKCTFCLTKEGYAFVSQHLGDLQDELTYKTYVETYNLYRKLFRIEPEIFACDLHPDYLSTRFTEEISQGKQLFRVQHHYAHIASVIGEHDLKEPVIGFAFDGTGYGSDGTVWGGEVVLVDGNSFKRVMSLALFDLPTGEGAVKNPYRISASMLLNIDPDFAFKIAGKELEIIQKIVSTKTNTFLTSSMGRLFDAVSVILGVGKTATYEGELAMKLEALTGGISLQECFSQGHYPVEIRLNQERNLHEIEWEPVLRAIIEDIKRKENKKVIACKFHNTVAQMIKKTAELILKETGVRNIAFSGGVFQNSLLNSLIEFIFASSRFKIYTHQTLPPNDGCISFGQVIYAAKNVLN